MLVKASYAAHWQNHPVATEMATQLEGSLHGSVSACEMERYRMDQVIQHELHRLRLRRTCQDESNRRRRTYTICACAYNTL